ncbi:MAG: sulfatase family protein [bacterium]
MAERPNIVLIMSDQQRYDSLACNGNKFVVTPELDRLAEQGARFTKCFTPFPVCTPARASMWTGVYPHAHGVIENVYGIDNAMASVARVTTTVFDILKERGYSTAYFGKWHLGEKNPGAFDVWEGFNSLGGHWIDGVTYGRYKPDVQTDQCIDFLRSAAKRAQPFIMVQGYYPPHDPFTAPRRFYEPYLGKGVPFPGYYAAVSNIDYNVGRIVRVVDELGLGENTLVMFFSDHGETFLYRPDGEHKFVCHDEAIRVPLIVRWTGHVRPGTVHDPIVGLEDLMPTLLDFAGAEAPAYLHGQSFRPWLAGASPSWRDSYYVENLTHNNRYPQRCIRTEDWKLILSDGGPHSLYNLRDDPEEELDVFDTPRDDSMKQFAHLPSYRAEIRRLAAQLRAYAVRIQDPLGIRLADAVMS